MIQRKTLLATARHYSYIQKGYDKDSKEYKLCQNIIDNCHAELDRREQRRQKYLDKNYKS